MKAAGAILVAAALLVGPRPARAAEFRAEVDRMSVSVGGLKKKLRRLSSMGSSSILNTIEVRPPFRVALALGA